MYIRFERIYTALKEAEREVCPKDTRNRSRSEICSDLDYAEFLEDHLNQIDSDARTAILAQIVREGYYAKMLETLKEAENEEEKE